MKKLFGTDGVRGIYGVDKKLNDTLARDLGYHATLVLTENVSHPKIIIGSDTRASCPNLKQALSEGIVQAGGEVIDVGIIPTPAVSVLVRELHADSGVVISASHNTFEHNGIKFFDSQGYKLPDTIEEKIEESLFNQEEHVASIPVNLKVLEDAGEIYIDFITKKRNHSLKGLKIVLDCSNGANYKLAPEYFKNLGAEVITIGDKPNGKNINENCGSLHLKGLSERVIEEGADFGFAFDGDADRCMAVDDLGHEMNGDKIMYLFAKKLKEEGNLNSNTVVMTQMSNLGLQESLDDIGISTVRTDVGDRYVLECMQKGNYNLGGEQSGHIILLDENTTGDGLLTAATLAEIFASTSKKAHELFDHFNAYPQIIVSVPANEKAKREYLDNKDIQERIRLMKMGANGILRYNIRPSGTEDLIRVMIEGLDGNYVIFIARDIASLIHDCTML